VEVGAVTSEAELLAEAGSDENTRLRNAFAQAARVSAALGGWDGSL
jgi:hypothetical protein